MQTLAQGSKMLRKLNPNLPVVTPPMVVLLPGSLCLALGAHSSAASDG
jgi:hypothetical protein